MRQLWLTKSFSFLSLEATVITERNMSVKKYIAQESHLRMGSQRMKETEQVNHVLMTNILHNLIWESFLACQRVPTKLFCKPPTALFNIASFNAPSCKYEIGTSSPHRCKLPGLASNGQDCCRIRLSIHPPPPPPVSSKHTRKWMQTWNALIETLSPLCAWVWRSKELSEAALYWHS